MNKKLIIIISIVLVVLIAGGTAVFLLLRDRKSTEDEFLPSESGFDAASGDLKSRKLTFYFIGQKFISPDESTSDEVLQAVNSRLKQELNTEVQFKIIYNQTKGYLEEIKSDIAAGLPCDAFYYFSGFPVALETLGNEGYITDLSKLFPQGAPNYYRQFTKDDIDAIKINGKVYIIPARIPAAYSTCAIVRQDLMEKYNIPEIKSYADYEVFLKTIKENEPDMIPMNYIDTTLGLFADSYGYVRLDAALGLVYKWDDPDRKILAWEQMPAFKECLNRIKSWRDNGYLMRSVGRVQSDREMITSGKWASFIGGLGDHFSYNTDLRAKGITEWNYKAYQLSDGYSARLSPMENGMAISAKSANAKRVLMFIDWLESSQENYDLYMYGVKGKHYIEKEDYIEPAGGAGDAYSFFNWVWRNPLRNIDYERTNMPAYKAEKSQYYDIIMEKTKYPPLNGFRPDYSTVDSINNSRRISFADMERSVYIGDYDESKVDAYIKGQKDAGIDNLISVIQEQADQFRAGH
ncbi:MAG TPA: extracellular solute-binding protein [Clostridia bacterium]|nr:extracellular solute-binding protein [Clostridia bacterium]